MSPARNLTEEVSNRQPVLPRAATVAIVDARLLAILALSRTRTVTLLQWRFSQGPHASLFPVTLKTDLPLRHGMWSGDGAIMAG
jgi:hypothetical protein